MNSNGLLRKNSAIRPSATAAIFLSPNYKKPRIELADAKLINIKVEQDSGEPLFRNQIYAHKFWIQPYRFVIYSFATAVLERFHQLQVFGFIFIYCHIIAKGNKVLTLHFWKISKPAQTWKFFPLPLFFNVALMNVKVLFKLFRLIKWLCWIELIFPRKSNSRKFPERVHG